MSAAAIAASLVPELPEGRSQAQATPAPGVSAISTNLSTAIESWDRLRQSDALQFSDYAGFMLAHPGWPGEARMRRLAETKADLAGVQPALMVDFFTRFEPQSAAAKARFAEALASTGREFDARVAARTAWTAAMFNPTSRRGCSPGSARPSPPPIRIGGWSVC